MDVENDTRPSSRVAPPTTSEPTQVTAQQLGCLQVIVEQLFRTLRDDLASTDALRNVERTLSAAEQQYRDCQEVYGAAREAGSCARPAGPVWSPPRVPHLEWMSRHPSRFESGPWVLAYRPVAEDALMHGWFLSGPAAPSAGLPMGVWSQAPLRAAEAWIHEHPVHDTDGSPGDLFDPADPAGGA